MNTRSRNWFAALVLIGFGAWSASNLAALKSENPFERATAAAAAYGHWPIEQVRFDGGKHRFLGLYSEVEARVTVSGAQAGAARIRLTHVPLRGWQTVAFELLPRP